MNIDDIKLELITLQKKDTKDAISLGFTTKEEWLKHCINSDHDEVAAGIIDLANRAKIPVLNIANMFDATMLLRATKEQNRTKASEKSK